MRNMFRQIADLSKAGKDLVLVSVIASSGATPRGAGARMLISDTGRVCGTIGGGAVEYRSEQIAARMLKERLSGQQDFSLTRDDVQNLGQKKHRNRINRGSRRALEYPVAGARIAWCFVW